MITLLLHLAFDVKGEPKLPPTERPCIERLRWYIYNHKTGDKTDPTDKLETLEPLKPFEELKVLPGDCIPNLNTVRD